MATQYPEPNERWKAQLKSRIDENLQNLLDDAKASYEQKVNETRPEDSTARRRLYLEYLQTTDNLKSFAADEYEYAVEREKQDLQWCLRAQESSETEVDTELEAELEALKEEQFAILKAIHMETTSADTSTTAPSAPAPQPETQTQLPQHQQQQHHDNDPFGFYDFASLSPLFTPTQLPGIQSDEESASASSEEESDHDDDESSDGSETDSRTPSPSPPSTPPLSSAPTSATSSQYCQTPHSVVTVQDEEARLRAERHAKQQEEFHRRAEEIRRRNKEKQLLKEGGELAVAKWEKPSPSSPSYYSDEDSMRYTTTTTIFPAFSSSASASASAYASSSTYTSSTVSTLASSSAPTSTPTSAASSAASSSCNSPTLPQSSTSLDPFVIAPLCEEDMIRLFIFHDQQWTRIASYHSLQWSDFPWPVLNFIGPRSERELTMQAVSDYVFASFGCESKTKSQPKSHSLLEASDFDFEGVRSKEKLKEIIAKWHPDRFESKFLVRVPETRGERERVRYGARLVVRHLTQLLGRFDDLDA